MPSKLQYLDEMKAVWAHVSAEWVRVGKEIAGPTGYNAVMAQSVRLSHHALPIFMYLLASTVIASSGIQIHLWGKAVPVVLWLLNVNYSQTRKSGLTMLAEKVAGVVDNNLRRELRLVFTRKMEKVDEQSKRRVPEHKDQSAGEEDDADEAGAAVNVVPPAPVHFVPKIWSTAYQGGTMERCKERVAGDFNQVKFDKRLAKLPALSEQEVQTLGVGLPLVCKLAKEKGLSGRLWGAQALVFDEMYEFLQDLSLLDTPSSVSAKRFMGDGPSASGQTPNAGWANRLMQVGRSEHETKTCGSYGDMEAPPVDTIVVGNLHSAPAVEMARGMRGDHGCQTRARMSIVTGQPIQPHEMYEAIPGVQTKEEWCPINTILAGLLGLDEHLVSPSKLAAHLDPTADDAEIPEYGEYFPNASGYPLTLPDGVQTKVRLRKDTSGRLDPEWLLAMRDVEIPPELDIEEATQRLLDVFGKEEHVLTFSDDAKKTFTSYAAYFNIEVHKLREAGDIDGGAAVGACPWKLAMLSACLMLWDIQWGQEEKPAIGTIHVSIPQSIVQRAFGLLELLVSIEAIMAGKEKEGSSWYSCAAMDREDKATHVDASADSNFEPRAQKTGMTDTEFARRVLFKMAIQGDVQGVYKVKSSEVFKIYNREAQKNGFTKPCVHDFRAVGKAMPSSLGCYKGDTDEWIVAFPSEDGDEEDHVVFADSLRTFANVEMDYLLDVLEKKKGEKRGAAGRESLVAKRQKP